MSSEAAALEKKLEALNMSDNSNVDQKSPTQEGEKKRRERKPRLTYEEQLARLEEERKHKKVVETGLNGSVKWFSLRGHYGFIEREDGGKDIFVHQTAISKSRIKMFYYRNLADGEKVQFDVAEGDKGPEAANVTGPDGTFVKGFRFNRFATRRRRSDFKDGESAGKPKGEFAEGDEKAEVNSEGDKKPRKRSNKNRRDRKERKENGEDRAVSEGAEPKSERSEQRGRRRAGRKVADKTKDDSGISADGHGDAPSLGANPVDAQI